MYKMHPIFVGSFKSESLILNRYDIENDRLIMVQIRVEFKGCISNSFLDQLKYCLFSAKYFHKIRTALSVYMCSSLLKLAPGSRDSSQA